MRTYVSVGTVDDVVLRMPPPVFFFALYDGKSFTSGGIQQGGWYAKSPVIKDIIGEPQSNNRGCDSGLRPDWCTDAPSAGWYHGLIIK